MAAGLKQAFAADASVVRDVLSKTLVTLSSKNVTTECMRRWPSAPNCFVQPGPMFLRVVAGAGFEPATFGL